jgi:hypothetical protein
MTYKFHANGYLGTVHRAGQTTLPPIIRKSECKRVFFSALFEKGLHLRDFSSILDFHQKGQGRYFPLKFEVNELLGRD